MNPRRLASSVLSRGVVASIVLHCSIAAAAYKLAAGSHAAEGPTTELAIDVDATQAPTPLTETPAEDAPKSVDALPNVVQPPRAFPTHHHDYPVPPSHDFTPHDPNAPHVRADTAQAQPLAGAPDPVVAPASEPAPRFTIVLGPHAGTGATAGAPNGDDDRTRGEDAVVYAESGVTVPAKLAARATAAYPRDARASEIEADVPLEIVVDARGAVVDARVVRHAGYGFDEAALGAIRGYRFTPAMREGRAVRVRMRWSIQFRLD